MDERKAYFIIFLIGIIVCPWFNGKLVEPYKSYYIESKDTGYVSCESDKEGNNSYAIQSYDGRYDNGKLISIDTDNNYVFDIHVKVGAKIIGTNIGKDMEDTYYIENNGFLKFTVDVYNLKTGKKIRTIDIKNKFEGLGLDDIQPDSYQKFFITKFNGKNFICFRVKNSEFSGDVSTDRGREFYLCLDDMSFYENDLPDIVENKEKSGASDSPKEYIPIKKLLPENLITLNVAVKNMFRINDSIYDDKIRIITSVRSLPYNNERLYSMFPKLKDKIMYLKRKSIFANIIFVFPKDIKAEEILELLSPEGHKLVFDGVIVKAEDSYDGFNHQVYSMEELRKYIKSGKN